MKRTLLLVVLLAGCGGTETDPLDTTSTTGGGGGSSTSSVTTGGGGGSSTTTTCTDTYANYGGTFMSTYCRSCHQHTSQFGSAAAVQASRSSIRSEISSGKMPEGTSLSSTEKARVLAWLDCGAP